MRTMWPVFGVIGVSGVLGVWVPCPAVAQDAGVGLTDPTAVVRAARGVSTVMVERTVRVRAAMGQETLVRVPTERGQCYDLVGYATGAVQVEAQVMFRDAEVGRALALANSAGQAVRQRFCADLGAPLYAVRVRTQGQSWWAVAVVPSAETTAATPAGATVSGGTVTGNPTGTTEPRDAGTVARPPTGGTEQDYVGGQIRGFAQRHPGMVPLTPAVRRALGTNETWQSTLALASGRCVDIVAAGVPSVGDLVIDLEDPSGNRVAQDDTHQAVESVHYCPSYAGSYRVQVRMFSGMGLTAIQTLTEP